jgi:hypothetical protein
LIEIKRAYDLPLDFCKDVYCEYSFYLNDEIKFQTIKVEGKNRDPVFDYKKHHTVDICTEPFIQYLLNDSLCFKLFGFPEVNLTKKGNDGNNSSIKKKSKTGNTSGHNLSGKRKGNDST